MNHARPNPRLLFAAPLAFVLITPSPSLGQPAQPTPAPQGASQSDSAARPYLAGNGFLSRGLNELAAAEYRKFLVANPDHAKAPLARYGLSVALVRMNDLEGAEHELKLLRSLASFEYSTEVEILAGQCAMRSSRFEDAAAAFRNALQRSPSSESADDACALLAECLYRVGNFKEAGSAAADVETRWPNSPLKARASLIRGMCELALGDNAAAAARLAALAESSDPSIKSRAALLGAQAAHRSGDLNKARELFETAISGGEKADAAEALLGLGTLHLQAGRPDDAARVLDRLIALPPPEQLRDSALIARARTYLESGKPDRAADLLARVPPGGPSADQAEYYLAKCELRAGEAGAAARRLAAARTSFPESSLLPEMLYDRSVALVRSEDDAGAMAAATEFLEKFPGHALRADALELLAGAELRAEKFESSLGHCREFLSKYQDHPRRSAVTLLEAENLSRLGRANDAEASLRAVASTTDSSEAGRAILRLGLSLAAQGKDAEAEPLLIKAAKGAAADTAARPAVLALGEIAFTAKRWNDAEKQFKQYLSWGREMPGAANAALKLGLCLARQGKNADAVSIFDTLLNNDDAETAGHAAFERAQCLAALGRTGEVTRAFERLAASDAPARFRSAALTQLGNLALAAGDSTKAASYFERAGQDAPAASKAEAAFLRAQALVASGKFDEASTTLADIDAAALSTEAASRVAPLRALAASRRGRDEAALAALDKALATDIADADLKNSLVYERGACLRALGRKEDAAAAFRTLASQSGATAQYATLELGVLEAEAGQHAAAAESFEKVRTARKSASEADGPDQLWAQATYRLASARMAMNQARPALAAAEELIKAGPPADLVAPTLYVAGEAALTLGQHRRSATYFDAFARDFQADPSFPAALLRLGEAHAGSGDWAASKAAYDRFLETLSSHELAFRARFGQGWAVENLGRHAEAINLYRKLVETHDGETAARAQFQIGECLFALKKLDDAVAELLKVEILYAYPEWSAAALYEAGRCLEAAGKPDLATQQYQAVQTKYAQTKWAAPAAERARAVAQGSPPPQPASTPATKKKTTRPAREAGRDQPKEKNP